MSNPETRAVLEGMMCRDPSGRTTAAEALAHFATLVL